MKTSYTRGAHHIGLSVRDLCVARDFFVEALGWSLVRDVPDYPAAFVSDGSILLTLWQVEDPAAATAFNRRSNVGLHHLALGVADDAALTEVFERVQTYPGTHIEFPPESIADGAKTRHFICAMPGGIRVEFATPFQ